ncbi:unnamed protein product [Urochloa humidicola]
MEPSPVTELACLGRSLVLAGRGAARQPPCSRRQDSVVASVDADVEFQLQLDRRSSVKLVTYDVKLMAATRPYDVTNASGQHGCSSLSRRQPN